MVAVHHVVMTTAKFAIVSVVISASLVISVTTLMKILTAARLAVTDANYVLTMKPAQFVLPDGLLKVVFVLNIVLKMTF